MEFGGGDVAGLLTNDLIVATLNSLKRQGLSDGSVANPRPPAPDAEAPDVADALRPRTPQGVLLPPYSDEEVDLLLSTADHVRPVRYVVRPR